MIAKVENRSELEMNEEGWRAVTYRSETKMFSTTRYAMRYLILTHNAQSETTYLTLVALFLLI